MLLIEHQALFGIMDKKKASILIEKYLKGKCTSDERAILLAHFNQLLDQNRDTLSPDEIRQLSKITWEAINEQIDKDQKEKPTIPLWRKWLPYVAAAVILLAGGWLLIERQTTETLTITTELEGDILPIGDGAILTLADGRAIELNAEQGGIDFSNQHITYQDGSSVYDEKLSTNHKYKVSTPKGASYQITLPDGTKVWLNGGSEIKYPGNFDKTKRSVEFEGEAYFAVVKQKDSPFVVVTKGQEIEVLGTEFNISTYHASSVKTTLVEGSVRVMAKSKPQSPLMLSPGEQSILHADGTIDKEKANLKKELAWRSGVFYFEETPFADIMQQVSRWYDVQVDYEAGIPQGTFSGIIGRNVSLRTLLEFFGETSQHEFRLENQTLKVTAKK